MLTIEEVWTAIIIVLCAILSACAKWLNGKGKESSRTLLAEAVAATVVALGVFFLYMEKGISVYVACIMSLGLGFAGVEVAEALSKYVVGLAEKKTGIPISAPGTESKEGE